jgi:hypothetical protein
MDDPKLQHHIPEEWICQPQCCESVRTHKVMVVHVAAVDTTVPRFLTYCLGYMTVPNAVAGGSCQTNSTVYSNRCV